MAAYAALVSLMNDLELIPNHPTHSFSFDNIQITSLSQTANSLVDFLESNSSHGCTREAAEVLESRIAAVAHAAHDVIESHIVDQIHAGTTLGGKARCYFFLDVQKAIDNMDFVRRKFKQFEVKSGLKAEHQKNSPPSTSSEPLSSSGNNVMVGFDDVLLRLLDMLTGEPSKQQAVIPIVGMAGMGKTTLARNAYGHLLIQHRFDVRVWATISQDYSVESILTELLYGERKSITCGNASGLGEKLHKKLWGRRYLVVLDDMWNIEAWDGIKMYLPDNRNGSRVVVTTRLSNLATLLNSLSFKMKFLEEDDSWQLFCRKTFGEGGDCPIELEEAGKKIVKRCKRLPLSLVVIGGHLRRSSRGVVYWEKVADYMNLFSSLGADDQCLKIINLSYENLPAYLKPCFLHMGIFQEDEWISNTRLINFWVGEGFVRAKKGLSLEEVAEEYLEDLIDRNLILVRERGLNGKASDCEIHDIVRELCLKVGKKDKFLRITEDTTPDIQWERRIVIPEGKQFNSDIIGALESAPQVRSVMRQGEWCLSELPVELRKLRVSSYANNMFLKKDGRCFPGANFQQVNLRYLAFCCERLTYSRHFIPSSISLLWNLQMLTVHNLGVQITVPYEIWEMSQLRHVEFLRVYLPHPLPSDKSYQEECIVVMQNLHALLGVEDLRLTEEVCKRMPNLKELSLLYCLLAGDREDSSHYCPHNLGRFNKLESLICDFGVNSNGRDIFLSFTFPTSLQELSLWNSCIFWDDLTMMIKYLPHLRSLQLVMIKGSEWELVGVVFPRLKVLSISRCDDLMCWNASNSHFPVLESLDVWHVPKLIEVPFDIGDIPTLGVIRLGRCSTSAAVSALRILAEQESFGNHDLRLEVDFKGMEEVRRFQEIAEEECLRSNNLHLSYQLNGRKSF